MIRAIIIEIIRIIIITTEIMEATQTLIEKITISIVEITEVMLFKTTIFKAIKTMPEFEGVAVYSLEEVGRILEANTLLNVVKKNFPDAVVENIRPRSGKREKLNKEIPF